MHSIKKRDFLTAGIGLGLGLAANLSTNLAGSALAQTAPAADAAAEGGGRGRRTIPTRMAKTTPLFKSPGMYANALAVNTDAPGGLWIGQQKITASQARIRGEPPPTGNMDEAAWLVDWNGKLLKTIVTPSRNTSGMAYGNGCVWMAANAAPEGVFQVDMNSNLVSHRQIPLAYEGQSGGGCHGAQWHDGKLWVAALRLGGVVRVDSVTWVADVLIPVRSDDRPRLHDLTFDDDGNMWVITGNTSHSYAEGKPGLNKYDGKTGQLLETVMFVPNSADPHGLVWYDGHLVSVDVGYHPDGWRDRESPFSGDIFRIDLI